jgi:hypothetical protein
MPEAAVSQITAVIKRTASQKNMLAQGAMILSGKRWWYTTRLFGIPMRDRPPPSADSQQCLESRAIFDRWLSRVHADKLMIKK